MHAQPQHTAWDLLICGATVFDGSSVEPERCDVAVSQGRVVALAKELSRDQAKEVIDAEGLWLLPGMLDIHTHLDLEVELDPRLPEVVRHGTTTVVMSNCSLGVAFGAQRRNGEDPIVDCFARVENVPKPVLKKVVDQIDWEDTQGYLDHFDPLPLGPNVVPLIPHSMLRAEVMGLGGSVTRQPSELELKRMEQLLDKAMQQGYAGFSTDALPFHYLSNDPHRKIKIPTQFGSYKELRRLTSVVRQYDRVWQATPPKDSRLQTMRNFLLSSGRLFGRPLKTTAVAAMDVVSNRSIARMALVLTRLINSALLQGRFRLQALAAPFKVYADGIHTPLAEETPVMRELIEPDLEDRAGRMALLSDPAYRARFKAEWYADKRGLSVARLKRWLGIMDDTLRRDLGDMILTERPHPQWKGLSLKTVYQRYRDWQRTGLAQGQDAELFGQLGKEVADDADFFMEMLKAFDTDLRWYVVAANDRPEVHRKLLFHDAIFPGFNDSGAHLTNMAYYDGNLRGLQAAQPQGLAAVARYVERMCAEPADFFGLPVGRIQVGAQADLVLIDPAELAQYDSEANTQLVHRAEFDHEQMVNRSDPVVRSVWIAGQLAWQEGAFGPDLGQQQMGQCLRIGLERAPQAVKLTSKAA
jgi:N-acyl-D-aspartate/D-glutamate deacylase